MAGLSTKDVKTGGGLPKLIEPGEHILKINAITLNRPEFEQIQKDQGYFLILEVETKPIEGFEGFQIDKDDESKGHYAGQIGHVKTSKYYYRDGSTKQGVEIHRDLEILKQLKNLCIATGCLDWFEKADGKYDTIELFVEAFNKAQPFKNKFLKFCIAGKEFEKKNNYVGHDLFLPKITKGRLPFEAEDAKVSKLIAFDEAEHIITMDQTPAGDFNGGDGGVADGEMLPSAGNIDLGEAPEFEL